MRGIYFLFLSALLTGCTFTPRDTGASFMFALQPVQIEQQAAQNDSHVVFMPTTSPELDTHRIALNRNSKRWDYYAGAKWSDFLPLLVQDNITKTLDEAHLFKRVTTSDSGLTGDKILKTEIRAFQAEYAAGRAAPVIKIRMTVSLLSRFERKPLASLAIKAAQPATGNSLTAIQAAFSTAFTEAQRQLVTQLAEIYKQ